MKQVPLNDPVTTIFRRFVKKDKVEAFEGWIKEMTTARSKFEGYIGMNIIRPSDHSRPEYVMILTFDSYENLRKWQESDDRINLVTKSIEFTEGESNIDDIRIEQQSGLEYWFDQPKLVVNRPRRYNMAILTAMALYPLILLSNLLIVPFLEFLPGPLV
ncbi:MAG: antibiotic biosynthesis monooxygenase [Candidatus Heimdallarchaeota archaeon]|nr:antibiotic biosynthesis monooxygenase [Candidatus Heimdallarchaeota archaeon]